MTENNALFWLNPRNVKVGMGFEIEPIGPIKVTEKFTSYNRLVMLVERKADNHKLIIKTFRFKDVPANMNTRENLKVIADQIELYKNELRRARVLTSHGVGFVFQNDVNGEPVLIQYEDYAGATCSHDLRRLPLSEMGKIRTIVDAILCDCLKPLFENAPNPFLPGSVIVGSDANPRNFTWMEVNGIVRGFSVDLFPAKIFNRMTGVYGLEFPEPEDEVVRSLGIERHYTMSGLIINFWSNLTRVRPELAKEFYLRIENFLRANGYDDVESFIDEYLLVSGHPNLRECPLRVGALPKNDIAGIIESWSFKDIFRLRLVANALAYYRSGSRDLLEEFFKLSHFQNNPLGPDVIQRTKALLLKMTDHPVDQMEE